MSKPKRRNTPCKLCGAVPAKVQIMEQLGKTIRNAGRVCQKCLDEWIAKQKSTENLD